MNQNNTLKNEIEIEQLKKNLYSKKTCKNHDLCHKTEINSQKKLEDNHKINIKNKLMQNNKIKQSRIPNNLNVER